MTLIIHPPLPKSPPSINWGHFHWYHATLSDNEALVISTLETNIGINDKKKVLQELSEKSNSSNKSNTQLINSCINNL